MCKPIRVVVDSQSVTPKKSGIGEYTKQIISALLTHHADTVTLYLYDGYQIVQVKNDEECYWIWDRINEGSFYSPRNQFRLLYLLNKKKHGLFFSPDFVIPLMNTRVPMVAMIPDIIPLILPQYLRKSKKSQLLFLYRWFCKATVRRCKRIITISENSKKDIVHHLGASVDKIDVIYLGKNFFSPISEPGKELMERIGVNQFFLYVGRKDPYKGIDLLIDAFVLFRKQYPSTIKLVLAGPPDKRYFDLSSLNYDEQIKKEIIDLGYVSDADLAWLYSRAKALILPSLYEGFGLPALQAMSYGTPVLCSRRGSLPEIVGDAGLFFDPKNSDEFINVLVQVIEDANLVQEKIEKGKQRSELFDWKFTAERIVHTFEKAISS